MIKKRKYKEMTNMPENELIVEPKLNFKESIRKKILMNFMNKKIYNRSTMRVRTDKEWCHHVVEME